MQTKEELEKLTVQQLKEKLKSRKLPISGAKSELINRLHESLVAEEKLLEAAGVSEVDLSNVNVDEVLGFDDTSIPEKKSTESPSKQSSQSSNGGALKSPPTSKPSTQNDIPAAATVQKDNAMDTSANSASNTPETGDTKKIMLKNAVKLGLPIDEAKAKRAERFGNASSDDDEKKVKRMERFGIVLSDDEDKKTKRAARFGIQAKANEPEDKEKLMQRAQRFGIPVKAGPASSEAGVAASPEILTKRAKRFGMPIDDEMEAKKKARAEKFGLAAP